jgi:hypothetical protein
MHRIRPPQLAASSFGGCRSMVRPSDATDPTVDLSRSGPANAPLVRIYIHCRCNWRRTAYARLPVAGKGDAVTEAASI